MKIVRLREKLRLVVLRLRMFIYTKIYKMNISKSALISYGAILDKAYPQGIKIGDETYIASGVVIMAHDFSTHKINHKRGVTIGSKCFIGVNAIVMPGVTIGDCVVIGSGSVVTKDIPSNCVACGNPAKVIRTGIHTTKYGQISKIDE